MAHTVEHRARALLLDGDSLLLMERDAPAGPASTTSPSAAERSPSTRP
ncbi:hypothetical protein [Nocardiopsis salina]|nr:hypothetical protein [Nocardiopsis salina]